MNSIQLLIAKIDAHHLVHPDHGPGCACHDEWSLELKRMVAEAALTDRTIQSFALLCRRFIDNMPYATGQPKPVSIPPLPEGYRYAGVIATPKAPQQSGWPVASYPAPGDPGFLGETPKDNSQDLCSHEGEAPQGLLDALYDPCTCPGCGIGVNPEPSGLCPICDTQLR